MIAYVKGMEEDVTEIGEQLGWIGAALRSSGSESGLTHCYPSFTLQTQPISTSIHSDATYIVRFSYERISRNGNVDRGQCWLPLFGNRTIVKGFPILSRGRQHQNHQPGLEIPLNIMAGLAEASRITIIDDQLLIKGFSTLFIPTRREADIVVWHMIYNEDDSHISYFDIRASGIAEQSAKQVNFSCLGHTRHILGWCSVAKHLAGMLSSPIL